jgi:hypothetical protein
MTTARKRTEGNGGNGVGGRGHGGYLNTLCMCVCVCVVYVCVCGYDLICSVPSLTRSHFFPALLFANRVPPHGHRCPGRPRVVEAVSLLIG